MKSKDLIFGAIALTGIGLVAYSIFRPSQSNTGTGGYQIPPGGSYAGWQNNSNTAIWVNFAGQIINTAGQIIGYFLTRPDGTKEPVITDNTVIDDNDWYEIGAAQTLFTRILPKANNCECANGKQCFGRYDCRCCDDAIKVPVVPGALPGPLRTGITDRYAPVYANRIIRMSGL